PGASPCAPRHFDRQFRGDTLHPAILEILDDMGLADPLHRLPHAKVEGGTLVTSRGLRAILELRRVKTRFPYIMIIPQEKLLDFLAAEAQKYPSFRLVMGANVQRLIEEDRVVRGVRYRMPDGSHDVRPLLTLVPDGRFSRIRPLAGFRPVPTSPPFNVLWFRLPRLADDIRAFAPTATFAEAPMQPPTGDAPAGEEFRMLARGSGYPQPWLGGQVRGRRGHVVGGMRRRPERPASH